MKVPKTKQFKKQNESFMEKLKFYLEKVKCSVNFSGESIGFTVLLIKSLVQTEFFTSTFKKHINYMWM